MSIVFEPHSAFNGKEASLICREAGTAIGTCEGEILCKVGRNPNGRGVVITLRDNAGHHAPPIYFATDEWETPGLLTGMIRDAISCMDDSHFVERSSLGL